MKVLYFNALQNEFAAGLDLTLKFIRYGTERVQADIPHQRIFGNIPQGL